MRVKYLAQEHNTMSPARARTRTAQSRDKCTNHEATAPPIIQAMAYKLKCDTIQNFEKLTYNFKKCETWNKIMENKKN